jgi:hypothetical protein
MKAKRIVMLAAPSQDELANNGASVEDWHCETIAEAKQRAKYWIGEGLGLGYAQVLVDDEVRFDFFAK